MAIDSYKVTTLLVVTFIIWLTFYIKLIINNFCANIKSKFTGEQVIEWIFFLKYIAQDILS